MEKLLEFEQLLSGISATYINIPSDKIEEVIRRDLERLGRFLGVDRCNLYLIDQGTKRVKFELPYAWWTEEDDLAMANLIDWMQKDPHFFDGLQYYFENWFAGKIVRFNKLEDLPEGAERLKETYRKFGTKSVLSVPLSVSGQVMGALLVATVHSSRDWPDELIPRLRLVGEAFVNAVARKRWEESLQAALTEIKEFKAKIEANYAYLREETNVNLDYRGIVGRSEALRGILTQIKQVGPTNATVLLLGETGTGKGLIARAVHNASRRKERPFMQVNCAAIAPTLVESEFFGHEKGAFTGAHGRRIGWFEKAKGTTLFLDEIGELSMEMQAKLLRVLQEGEFERVGGNETVKTDVRVVAATNRDLATEVEAGRFRQDLWYRLTVFPIHVPPLRKRLDDIPLFVNLFVTKFAKWIGKTFEPIPQKTIAGLQAHSWPGNVRELENLIERAVITSTDGHLRIEIPEEPAERRSDMAKTLEEHEREYIEKILEDTYWRIEGSQGAAFRLGLNPSTLRARMRKLGIRRPSFRGTAGGLTPHQHRQPHQPVK